MSKTAAEVRPLLSKGERDMLVKRFADRVLQAQLDAGRLGLPAAVDLIDKAAAAALKELRRQDRAAGRKR